MALFQAQAYPDWSWEVCEQIAALLSSALMRVSTSSAWHVHFSNRFSSHFGAFGEGWELPAVAVEGGREGVGRSGRAGDSWCDHTNPLRSIIC